ncbi:MAG TPA: SAM-dependent methyltransferase [Caldimonas sp.]|nr:SAM-dependent methyltransferase [Caldimonas sp.]
MNEPKSQPQAARGASRTALGAAALRWLHQTIDGEPKILVDHVSGLLLGDGVLRATAAHLGDPHSPEVLALRSHVVLRSRYCEDRLASAVRQGVSQLIVLGAGLDTFAYRQPEWARGLRIYEVDQPASQAEKRRLLSDACIAIPDNVEFVAIDFERTSLAAGLKAAAVAFSRKTFFSCLGVTMYLSEDAVDALFEVVASFPVGSEIVFTYRQASRDGESALGQRVSALGEPWTFHIEPGALAHKLNVLGFASLEELDPLDADVLYFRGRTDGLHAPSRRGIAAAVVGECHASAGEEVRGAMAQPPPIELQPPGIARWRDGGTGVDWVHAFDSGRLGLNVMVQALTHGNEICGAIALDWLLAQRFRPQAGSLTLAFANVAAYARFDPADPFPSRLVDEDYNRIWADATLFGPGDTVELRRARQLRPFVDAAERLLDIHSMSEPCRPLMVCGTVEKNVAYARELGVPGDLLVDTGHPAGLRMVERGGFGDPQSPKLALLIECGQHWERAAADVAIDALVRFLGLTGVADAAWVQANVRLPLPPLQRLVRVTEPVVARSADFRFLVPTVGLSVVAKAGTPIAQDGDHVWVTPYDDAVLVMPGTRNLKPGGTAARLGRFETR